MTKYAFDDLQNAKLPAKDLIKVAARRLFAERGYDGVTTREIVKAAGQKNQGSLAYYFGTKEELAKEIVVDGARLIDERRNDWLDELEAKGGPRTVREITDVILFSSVRLSRGGQHKEDSYNRFLVQLNMSHPEIFHKAIGNEWNRGFQRCCDYLRKLMPRMPMPVKNQRLQFILSYCGSLLSMREGVLADVNRDPRLWASEGTLQHLSQSMAAILEAPYEKGRFTKEEFDELEDKPKEHAS